METTALILTICATALTLFTTIFTGILAYCAYQGLKAWKKQLKGTKEFDVAKEILLILYEVKNHYSSLDRHESSLNFIERTLISNNGLTWRDKIHFQVIAEGIQEFIVKSKEISEKAKNNLEQLSLEGEVLLGSAVAEEIRMAGAYFDFIADFATYEHVYGYDNDPNETNDLALIKKSLENALDWARKTREAHTKLFTKIDTLEHELKQRL